MDKGFESQRICADRRLRRLGRECVREFYQDSLKLLKAAYLLANELPNKERYNLSDQMRRASCSILLNIAEGYGRYHYLERLQFLYITRGSLAETLSAFIIAESIGYCTTERKLELADVAESNGESPMAIDWVRSLKEKIEKNLSGYCRFIKSQQQGKNE